MEAAELDVDLRNANVVLSLLSPFSSVRAAFKGEKAICEVKEVTI